MPIRADASRLKSRMKQISQATRLAPYALSTVATQTIGDVSDNAVTRLAGREDQVGFDLPQFLQNISQPGALFVSGGKGQVGILNEWLMGTIDDFDAISVDPKLWHAGTGFGELFRIRIFDRLDKRRDLAADRQAVWGAKTPQWYLMEYGYTGGGAYPPVPASHFIASATRPDRLTLRLRNVMSSLYRGIPRR